MGSEKLSECEKLTNLHAAKGQGLWSEAWHPGTQNMGQTSVCGHTNKPLRGEARGGLTTEQAAKNWKMSLQSCERTFDARGLQDGKIQAISAPRGRERPTKGKKPGAGRWSCWIQKFSSAGARRREARWLRMTTESSCRRSPGRIEASSSPQLPTSAHPIRLLPHPSK